MTELSLVVDLCGHTKSPVIMPSSDLQVKGAREHNLRSIDVTLPRNQLICLTGVSGSGKSSLAFDTVFAEGQRRYVESLSSFARQFLGQGQKNQGSFLARSKMD